MKEALLNELVSELILAEAEDPFKDRLPAWEHFLQTIGRNDDEAVIATEKLFFALEWSGGGRVLVSLLESRELASRPAAILLARLWLSGKTHLLDHEHPQRWIVPWFRKARDHAGDVLMWKGWHAYEALKNLNIIVFRGSHDRRADLNPSWTINIGAARYFAAKGPQHPEPGRIYMAKVDKADVLAVFDAVTAYELVVDPRGLRDVKLIEFAGMPLTEPSLTMRTI